MLTRAEFELVASARAMDRAMKHDVVIETAASIYNLSEMVRELVAIILKSQHGPWEVQPDADEPELDGLIT